MEAVRVRHDLFLTQQRTSDLKVSDREVLIGGEWATEVAGFEWTMVPVGGGPAAVDRGSYMCSWRASPSHRMRVHGSAGSWHGSGGRPEQRTYGTTPQNA